MEISSIGTAGGGIQQQSVVARAPQQEYPDPERTRQQVNNSSETQAPKKVETVQESAPQAPERNEPAQSNEQPKVFVNAQGQKTGTIISVTA